MARHERLSPDADATPVTPPATAPEAVAPAAEPPAPARKGRRRAVLGLLALAVLGGGAYEGHAWWTEGRFMVETDDAYVQADVTLIAARVQGYVAEVLVGANDRVAAGDVLIRLDDGDARIALRTAESRVATAGDTLARIDAQVEAAQAAVAQAQAGQDAAEAQLRAAQAAAGRTASLAESNVAAQAQLDDATAARDTAQAAVAQAQAAVASARAQVAVLRAQRAEAEGSRDELRLAVDQARRNLDLTVLRAPAAGTVANLSLEVGDLVAPGARLAALVPDGGLYVEANYKETQMAGVAPGAAVSLAFDVLPGQEFEGTVQSVSPATGSVFSLLPADNATGNFTKVVQRVPVRIAIPDEALATGALRAGLSVRAEVDRRTVPAAPVETPVETPADTPADLPVADAGALGGA